eukprot:TRINITY_DN25042_c0_g1_i1.p1 TRINITY_DN25042_c0_g1~~TRINITY_DN25042_c0_g1_i1.p1  ORF type:complete len:184 (+),score=17.56 TRINITY_DN25042_c0_g1_i1:69-554(+)
MYKVVVCLAVLLATCQACNLMQRLKVKHQWNEAFGTGSQRASLGKALWRSIFSQAPGVVDKFFTNVDGHDISSPKFQAHIARVFGGFDLCISQLPEEDILNSQLNHLHTQHEEMGISSEYFDTFRKALMLGVESTIESCYDAEAWESCTSLIARGIGGGVE